MTDTLIEQIEALKSQSGRSSTWNNAINACLEIIMGDAAIRKDAGGSHQANTTSPDNQTLNGCRAAFEVWIISMEARRQCNAQDLAFAAWKAAIKYGSKLDIDELIKDIRKSKQTEEMTVASYIGYNLGLERAIWLIGDHRDKANTAWGLKNE